MSPEDSLSRPIAEVTVDAPGKRLREREPQASVVAPVVPEHEHGRRARKASGFGYHLNAVLLVRQSPVGILKAISDEVVALRAKSVGLSVTVRLDGDANYLTFPAGRDVDHACRRDLGRVNYRVDAKVAVADRNCRECERLGMTAPPSIEPRASPVASADELHSHSAARGDIAEQPAAPPPFQWPVGDTHVNDPLLRRPVLDVEVIREFNGQVPAYASTRQRVERKLRHPRRRGQQRGSATP